MKKKVVRIEYAEEDKTPLIFVYDLERFEIVISEYHEEVLINQIKLTFTEVESLNWWLNKLT